MAPRAGCLLLPLLFIGWARVISVDASSITTDMVDVDMSSVTSLSSTSIPPPVSCDDDPATLCAGHDVGDKVPNPFDCSTYYVCKDDSHFLFDDPLPCPDGEIFDMASSQCKPDGECSFDCNEPGGGGGCLYTCEGNVNGMIADPFDCSVYHQCNAADPGPAMTCSGDKPYFDGEGCVAEESACCHCRPYCYKGDMYKKVEDPTDCRKFFYCLDENQMTDIPGECKDGEHFDLHAGDCSNTAPCVTLCRNVVDGDGCIDPYTCQELGYFPKCKTQCLREYYHCVEVSDDYATPETCPNDLVFNPDTLTCIKSETCPYTHK